MKARNPSALKIEAHSVGAYYLCLVLLLSIFSACASFGAESQKNGTGYYEKISPSDVVDNNPSSWWIKASDPTAWSAAGARYSFTVGSACGISASIYYYTSDGFLGFTAEGATLKAYNWQTGQWEQIGLPPRRNGSSAAGWSGAYTVQPAHLSSGGTVRIEVTTREWTHLYIRYVKVGYTLDSIAPSQPGRPDLAASDDTGMSWTDNVTRQTSALTFSWSPSYDSGGCTTAVAGYEWNLDNGTWQFTPNTVVDISAGEGPHTFYVRAKDNAGIRSIANTLSFRVDITAPLPPFFVTPSEWAPVTDTTPNLAWSGVADAWKYKARVREHNFPYPGLQESGELFNPSWTVGSPLAFAQWGWQVKAWDIAGNEGAYGKNGIVDNWGHFTVVQQPPPKVTSPNPSHGATSLPLDLTLSWQRGGGTTAKYDVYFGTSSSALSRVITDQTGTPYTPSRRNTGTTYYWRVDAKNSSGAVTTGDVWSFTTCGNSAPASSTGNRNAQEYGDALYRYLPEWFWGLVRMNYNHTGVFSGLASDGSKRTFESFGGDGDSTGEGSFDTSFLNYGTGYYGAFTPSQFADTMTFTDRRAVVGKAKEVADAFIYYPSWVDTINALDPKSGWVAPIDPEEIKAIRCDGVVEYAYERCNIRLWRNCLKGDNTWNIANNPSEHNNTPNGFDVFANPEYELSPWAQRGAPGSSSVGPGYSGPNWPDTRMTRPSVINLPSVAAPEVLYLSDSYADIRFRATDESGIFRVNYRINGIAQTPLTNPDRHPTSGTYVTPTVRVLAAGGCSAEVRVSAQDHGGNTCAETAYTVSFKPQKPVSPNPPTGITGRPINQTLSWQNGGCATSYDVYFGTTNPPSFRGNQTAITYNPGPLNYSTPYYWRIDARSSTLTTQGDVWSFRTQPESDTQPPTVLINTPTNGQSFTNSSIVVSGTASDNFGVMDVKVRVNNGPWQVATGTTNWSLSVTLNDGPNTIEAQSTDTSGNPSSLASVSVSLARPASPDLTIASFAVAPTTGTSGAPAQVNVTICNNGSATASNFAVTVWMSRSTEPGCGAFFILDDTGTPTTSVVPPEDGGSYTWTIFNLPPGQCQQLSTEFVNLPAATGQHTAWAFVDSHCVVDESREDNNKASRTYSVIPCSYSLLPSSITLSATGQSSCFSVQTTSGCDWFVTENCSWITVTSGHSGTGNGAVCISVMPNTSTLSRTCALTVADRAFYVTQLGTVDGKPDLIVQSLALNKTSHTSGEKGTARVVIKNQSTVSTGGSFTVDLYRSAPGDVACSAPYYTRRFAGPLAAGASTTLNIGFNNITVTTAGTWVMRVYVDSTCVVAESNEANNQATITYNVGNPPNSDLVVHSLALNKSYYAVGEAGTATIVVRNQGTGGTGVGCNVDLYLNATLTVGCSTTTYHRRESSPILLAGASHTILSPFTALYAGTVTMRAFADSKCVVAEANETNNQKTLSYGVGTVTPIPCTYTITPSGRTHTSAAGTGSVTVTSSAATCSWPATSYASWVSITSGSGGSGNGVVSYSVTTNTSTMVRAGTLSIAGKTFTVTQQGSSSACTYQILPTSAFIGRRGGMVEVYVTAPQGCGWVTTNNASWISILSGSNGSGNGEVALGVASNNTGVPRLATVTIAGQPFTVSQQ